ncbi:pseudouridine synthase [Rhizobium sp. KAs_5_22]|uniref:pseudouridine synthase n=1 Tax=Ciceribacter selenitireducens TaxID=448181 RepID=UPI00048D0B98|nr:pseudouridine synthase [Rhizobium sp. KAs_5_22]
MTFKDKSRRPGPKTSERGGKPLTRKPSTASDKPAPKAAKAQASVDAEDGVKPERISKLLARAGVASRRDIERMVMEGRVTLNGKVLDTPVVNATFADTIEVDGQPIRGIERTRLWLYHKPAGLVTTNADPEGRSTVFENLPEDLPRVMSIGRLDINTEGLLLLTNDGGLARVLELPTTGWLRRYRVRAYGEIDQPALDKLKEGIAVDGVLYGAIDATLDRKQGHNVWITMGLREGKNREIKNVLGALGLEVNRLIRISYGPFQLGDLPEGKVVEVRGRMLRDQLGPRLIEEAKANFDAPIFDHGGADEEEEAAPAKARPAKSEWAREEKPRGEGRREGKPEDRREQALGRLDTRRDEPRGKPQGKRAGDDRGKGDFGDKRGFGPRADRSDSRGDFADKPRRTPGSSRTANVWMAPGARPVSEKKAGEAAAAEKRPPRARPDGSVDKRYGRNKDGKPTKSLNRFDPDRKGKSDYGRPDPGPRVLVSRTRDEEGEWIRSEEPARGKDDAGFGGKRDFGGRPDRGDRSERPARTGDRPRSDRPRGDGPREGRPYEARARDDRPRGDRPFGDKPRGPRSNDDRPRGDRPFGDKPRGPRSADSRPAGDRPYGDKPRAPRSADSRPAGDRPFGDKPRGPRSDSRPAGDRPFGDKPRGSKPFGGKPGGKPGGPKPFSGKPRGDRPGGGKPAGGRGPAKGKR